jgi:hypothetical protein
MAVKLRTTLTDAGAAARRKVRGLRGKHEASAPAEPAPDAALAADNGQAVSAEPSESLMTQVWGAIKRARLVIFIVLAVSQALIALVTWRIRVLRGRRGGGGNEQEALEALGERLGGIAGALDDD